MASKNGSEMVLNIQARWDDEAHVWVALSDDVPGLATEAPSLDELFRTLQVLVPELLELNGLSKADTDTVPFHLVAANDAAATF